MGCKTRDARGRYGTYTGPLTMEERFWPKVDRRGDGDCWLWLGGKMKRGYGVLTQNAGGKRVRLLAHRVSVLLSGREIPADREVMHACDNPPCVNPSHLVVGTHRENMRDAYAKGFFGVKGRVLLSFDQVLEIRASTADRRDLAKQYGVTTKHISRIQRGKQRMVA